MLSNPYFFLFVNIGCISILALFHLPDRIARKISIFQ